MSFNKVVLLVGGYGNCCLEVGYVWLYLRGVSDVW